MIVDPVTTRWAEALFLTAQRKGVLEQVSQDVESLTAALSPPAVRAFFFGARTDLSAKREKIKALTDTLSELTQNFVGLLFDKRREGVLQNLGEAFRQRTLIERGVVEGVVETPRPLDAAQMEELTSKLSQSLGKQVQLEARTSPELVAGVRVRVGGQMIDQSVSGRLARLRQKLLDSPLPIHGTGTAQ